MKGFPLMEIISSSIKAVVKIFDDIYQQGWMLYFVLGLIALAVIIIWYT